jgi:hypothetical protein
MKVLSESQIDNLVKGLKEIARQNPNGFTVYLYDLQPITSGWSVALKETQNSHSDEGLKHVIAVANTKTGIVGGWREDGRFWWDAVLIFDNEEEATIAGHQNEQIAIYHIEKNYVKFL